MCSCQVRRIGGGAGHHDLHDARVVAVGAPLRTQPGEFAVELDTDAAAHADDHGLAVEGFEALLEVSDDVLGDLPDALLCADDRLQLRPLRLQLLLALDFLALGGLFELRVDLRLLTLVEGQFGEAALVVDRHRRVVVDRAPDVVDADVVAEDGPGIGVLELDGCAGEADEGGVGQGVAHVAGVAVDEVVLAAVGLIGDDHDVAAVGERRMAVASLLGEELLDGGEDHASGVH